MQWEYFTRDYLLGRRERKPEKPAQAPQLVTKRISRVDQEIVNALCDNSRTSAADIARTVSNIDDGLHSVTADTVLKHIRKLEKEDIVSRYNVVLGHSAIGHFHYKVLLYLNRSSDEQEKELIEYCRQCGNIIIVVKALGEWDLEIDIEAESVAEYKEIMAELTQKFVNIIRDYDSLMITDVLKYALTEETKVN